MDRRSFLKSTASLAAAALLPTWLHVQEPAPINLQAFCGKEGCSPDHRFNMTAPFVQRGRSLHKYATDARICVRIAAPGEYAAADATKLPPIETLPWSHDNERGWKPWPRRDWLTADSQPCLTCEGTGSLTQDSTDCENCDGTGHEWMENGWNPRPCKRCLGFGWNTDYPCPECIGKGKHPLDRRPGILRIDGEYIAAHYDLIMRLHLGEMEYKVITYPMIHYAIGQKLVLFRFASGVGMLCPLDKKTAETAIQRAK